MVQTAFLASSTNTGAMPPLMHFFTHSAPDPACLAPHIESEIHPSILVESAAPAAVAVSAKPANRSARTLFMRNLQGIGKPRSAFIMLYRPRFGKTFRVSGLRGIGRSEERRVGKERTSRW